MNYKKCISVIAVFAAVILIGITLTSIALSLVIAHQETLEFCFSPGCFDFAAKALQEPIKVFKVGVEFGTYAFAAIGAATAILTYTNSVKTEKTNRHFQKCSEFKNFTSALASQENSGINIQNFNANVYYNFLFPYSTDAYFTPSELYKNTINHIEEQIAETHANFIPGNRRSIEGHYSKMLGLFHTLGITLEEPTEDLLIILEPKLFAFIDSINKQFTHIEVHLQSKARDYSRLV